MKISASEKLPQNRIMFARIKPIKTISAVSVYTVVNIEINVQKKKNSDLQQGVDRIIRIRCMIQQQWDMYSFSSIVYVHWISSHCR